MTTAVRLEDAVGYFRVSGPGQAGEKHVSLEVQAAAFADHCRSLGLSPVTTFTDIATGLVWVGRGAHQVDVTNGLFPTS